MNPQCPGCHGSGAHVIRYGTFYRRDDARKIQRFHCKSCSQSFSSATLSDAYRQQRRRINQSIKELLASGVSMRRIAKLHRISKCTVAARLPFLAARARAEHKRWLDKHGPFDEVQFDDLETYEHTKCKPLTVPAVVDKRTQRVIGFAVAQIPAKGLLAAISRAKYGYRADKSREARRVLFKSITPYILPTATFESDQHKHYPVVMKQHFPKATHIAYKSRRSRSAGQGELKRVGFDHLFAINHTFAMYRANTNRLIRKTWCCTKRPDRLSDHLAIFVSLYNQGFMDSNWKKKRKFAEVVV